MDGNPLAFMGVLPLACDATKQSRTARMRREIATASWPCSPQNPHGMERLSPCSASLAAAATNDWPRKGISRLYEGPPRTDDVSCSNNRPNSTLQAVMRSGADFHAQIRSLVVTTLIPTHFGKRWFRLGHSGGCLRKREIGARRALRIYSVVQYSHICRRPTYFQLKVDPIIPVRLGRRSTQNGFAVPVIREGSSSNESTQSFCQQLWGQQ